ncbi:vigilin-like isoform X2 [Ostrea edulis]|uniref:vigilin-like isoform X2 n=1 Tax=Ostrea edulis TaxID=37623 RepID=UPI0024AFE7FE|nr:vigilin-like isoform X2 [Ostrea edulis]
MATYILRRMHYQKLHKFSVLLNSQQSSLLRTNNLRRVCTSSRLCSDVSSSGGHTESSVTGEKENGANKTFWLPKTSAFALSKNKDQIGKETSSTVQLDLESTDGEKVPVHITAGSLHDLIKAVVEIDGVLQSHISQMRDSLPLQDRLEELLFIPKQSAEQLSSKNMYFLREIKIETASLIDILYDVQNEHGVLVTISAAQKENIADAMEKIQKFILTAKGEIVIDNQVARRLIGPKGARIAALKKETGAAIFVRYENNSDEAHVLVQAENQKKLEAAVAKIKETVDGISRREKKKFELTVMEKKKLIGKGGKNLKRLHEELVEVYANIDLAYGDSTDLWLEGEAALFDKAVAKMQKELNRLNSSDFVTVNSSVAQQLIASQGARVKELEKQTGTRISVKTIESDADVDVTVQAKSPMELETALEKIHEVIREISRRKMKKFELTVDEKGKLIGKGGGNLKRLRDEMSKMNAKINLGYRESTDLWVEADEDTFDKAVALIQKELDKRKSMAFTTFKVPQMVGINIIGPKGARVTELEKQTGAKISLQRKDADDEFDVKVQATSSVELKKVVKKIQEVIKDISSVNGQIPITSQDKRQLLRFKGAKIKELQKQTGASIVLRFNEKNDEPKVIVQAKSPMELETAVDKINEELEKLRCEEVSESLSLTWSERGQLLGTGGETFKEIRETLQQKGVEIDVLIENKKVTVKVTGLSEESVQEAVAMIQEKATAKRVTETITLKPHKTQGMFIGLGGQNIKRIYNSLPRGVHLQVNTNDEGETKILVSASNESDLKKAVEKVQEENEREGVSADMDLSRLQIKTLIGDGGTGIRKIRDAIRKIGGRIHIPTDFRDTKVVVTAQSKEDLETVIEMILDQTMKQREEVEVSKDTIIKLMIGKRKELLEKYGNQLRLFFPGTQVLRDKEATTAPLWIECQNPEVTKEVLAEIEELKEMELVKQTKTLPVVVSRQMFANGAQFLSDIGAETKCYLCNTFVFDGSEVDIYGRNQEDVNAAIARLNEHVSSSSTPERRGPRDDMLTDKGKFTNERDEMMYRIEEALDRGEVEIKEKLDIPEDFSFSKVKPLNIWSKEDLLKPEPKDPIDNLWYRLEREEHEKLISNRVTYNDFEEMIQLTKQGKMWHYPIDNEQGIEEEKDVSFTDHVFFDDLLEDFPKSGPISKFMEQVTVGLAQNPNLTVKEKREHVEWYKNYFQEKAEVLKDTFGETGDLKTFLTTDLSKKRQSEED